MGAFRQVKLRKPAEREPRVRYASPLLDVTLRTSFQIWKLQIIVLYLYKKEMQYFRTKFLEEANRFISGLPIKTIKKILYNVDLAEQTNDPKLF